MKQSHQISISVSGVFIAAFAAICLVLVVAMAVPAQAAMLSFCQNNNTGVLKFAPKTLICPKNYTLVQFDTSDPDTLNLIWYECTNSFTCYCGTLTQVSISSAMICGMSPWSHYGMLMYGYHIITNGQYGWQAGCWDVTANQGYAPQVLRVLCYEP